MMRFLVPFVALGLSVVLGVGCSRTGGPSPRTLSTEPRVTPIEAGSIRVDGSGRVFGTMTIAAMTPETAKRLRYLEKAIRTTLGGDLRIQIEPESSSNAILVVGEGIIRLSHRGDQPSARERERADKEVQSTQRRVRADHPLLTIPYRLADGAVPLSQRPSLLILFGGRYGSKGAVTGLIGNYRLPRAPGALDAAQAKRWVNLMVWVMTGDLSGGSDS